MVLLLVFMQLTRDLFAIAKFLFIIINISCGTRRKSITVNNRETMIPNRHSYSDSDMLWRLINCHIIIIIIIIIIVYHKSW